jgi:uncharacterized protein YggU (UPF0235/DUF167 family)
MEMNPVQKILGNKINMKINKKVLFDIAKNRENGYTNEEIINYLIKKYDIDSQTAKQILQIAIWHGSEKTGKIVNDAYDAFYNPSDIKLR